MKKVRNSLNIKFDSEPVYGDNDNRQFVKQVSAVIPGYDIYGIF